MQKNIYKSRRAAHTCSVIMMIAILLLVCLAQTPAAWASDAVYSTSGTGTNKNERFTVNEGSAVQLQLHVSEPLKSVGIMISRGGNEQSVRISLYSWNQNIVTTLEGAPVLVKEYQNWEPNSILTADTSAAGMEPLPAGEYVYEMEVLKGSVLVTVCMPAAEGTQSYVNHYTREGSYTGEVVLAKKTDKPFLPVSTNENYPFHSAPAEWKPSEDDAIVQMGVDPTQWSAVDGLGRTLPVYEDVGSKKDKKVGIFYWPTHYYFSNYRPINITELMKEHPDMATDYYHPLWQEYSGLYYWNEPLFGYYNQYDDYVLRKHAEMLADAGVDFVLFDCTNGNYTWEEGYMNLLRVWSEAREQGVRTPQVAFIMQFTFTGDTLSSLTQVYEAIYRDGKYQDLWFYWKGKPLIVAHSYGLNPENLLEKEILDFFTFRAGDPSYFGADQSNDFWGWLHIYPQARYLNEDGSVEMTTVGTAMNVNWETMQGSAMNNPHNMGRSYTSQKGYSYSYPYRGRTVTVNADTENAIRYGLNFQEQWDYAIAQDPELIFVTGWNEWTAGRYENWGYVDNAFPDQYDDENSRDIEPSKGQLKDYYYYQLAANIRRYKGASQRPVQTEPKTIDITGNIEQWLDSDIVTYNHYIRNTYERDVEGQGGIRYQNDAVRNDIRTARVSYDDENLYFYVETVDSLTPASDENWMRLLLDTQAATADSTDWEEFEYILNRTSPTDTEATLTEATLERSLGGWQWETVGKVRCTVQDNILQVEIPRSLIGMTEPYFSFNFKWCDANISDGDIMSLYTDGDSAPGGRFAFHFSSGNLNPAEAQTQDQSLRLVFIIVITAAVLSALTALAFLLLLRKKRKVSK